MKLAMIFPGQGAQSVGMVDALAGEFPQVRARFDVASQVLGFDLWALVHEGPAEVLNATSNTQPALLAASVATWDAWLAAGGARPSLLAGHSFGEYSALVCAGALEYAGAVALVAARGRFMQEAVAPGAGAMAAVLGLDLPALHEVCREAGAAGIAQCANLNAPGQVVLSGDTAGVARAGELAKARGAKKVIPLSVSVPAHCQLMAPAATRYRTMIEATRFSPPQIPVIHNVDVSAHSDPDEIREVLIAQLAHSVRWQETIERFAAEGVTHALECGPGKVLGPLVKRCAPGMATASLATPDDLRASLTIGA
ncbi:MAG: ACP S-malonyltransferase [Gammaproteobacteria bacterium]|nr:ACP S-malonyltransferase [Gammaproteobacteria bacterium]